MSVWTNTDLSPSYPIEINIIFVRPTLLLNWTYFFPTHFPKSQMDFLCGFSFNVYCLFACNQYVSNACFNTKIRQKKKSQKKNGNLAKYIFIEKEEKWTDNVTKAMFAENTRSVYRKKRAESIVWPGMTWKRFYCDLPWAMMKQKWGTQPHSRHLTM